MNNKCPVSSYIPKITTKGARGEGCVARSFPGLFRRMFAGAGRGQQEAAG